jgi:hypothetical protein
VAHSPTTSMSPSSRRSDTTRCRAMGSSSTTSVRIFVTRGRPRCARRARRAGSRHGRGWSQRP